MLVDTNRAMVVTIFTYIFALAVFGMSFYGLVIYPFVLDDIVRGYLIAAGTGAAGFVFGNEIAKQAAGSFAKGLMTPVPTANGTTVSPPAGAATTTTVATDPADAGG